jgi:hypothetical protein
MTDTTIPAAPGDDHDDEPGRLREWADRLRAIGCSVRADAGHLPHRGAYRYLITPPGVYLDAMTRKAREIGFDPDGGGLSVEHNAIHLRAAWQRGAVGLMRELHLAAQPPVYGPRGPVIVHGRVEGHYLFEAIGESRAEVEQVLLSTYAAHVGAMPEGQAEVDWLRQIIADDGVSWTELRLGEGAIDGETVSA